MRSGLLSEREVVPVATTAPVKRPSPWEAALRRWLTRNSPAQRTELEEVADEVFARLSRYSDDTLVKSPQKFVLLVAANVVDEWRGDLDCEAPDQAVVIAEGPSDTDCVPNKKLAKQVRAALEKLPERQRRMLLMHVNEGLTYQEIAKVVRMTPRLVQRDLARAYAVVRGAVGEKALDMVSA